MQPQRKLFSLSISMVTCILVFAQTSESNFKRLYSLVDTWKMETSKGFLYESWQNVGNNFLTYGSSIIVFNEPATFNNRMNQIRRSNAPEHHELEITKLIWLFLNVITQQ